MYPKVRFRGFDASQEFKNCLLSEVARNLDNKRIPITANKRKKGKIPYFGSNGIQDYVKGYTHNGTFILIAEDGANNLKHYPVIKATGKIWVNNHAHVLQALDKKIDFNYLYFLLFKYNFEKYLVGSGRYKLNAAVLEKLPIKICNSKNEQIAIGKILASIDNLLSLQQRKLELEKQLELYVTDDLLVYETESKIIPKVRFNSFCQSWKKVKLKEIIGKIQSGNRLPKTNLEEGSIPYILAQSKNNGIYMYISKDTLDFNGNALKLFPADSITFSIDNPQAIYYQPEPFYTSNIMRVIHSQHLNKFDYMFIIMNLKKYTKEFDWSRKFSGPVVSNLQVSIPGNIDERRKIGKLICKIQLHRLLDEKAKREIIKLKRFLLQNLFI
ncbi:restriction endonuclease subunit S [Lactobacillus mulieris]|uniref:Restriction endonuclease subunit S n=1 Tax=Lactobacillus mulieris TaxID=2508708 RepID=A0AAW5WXL5_9LACO|nr:restriction endonuclease subunit S [Lactobacillus mulieris]MCZ9678304.1 restriction endonuclease subunit S [Lactobacillus mulieris]